MQTVTLIPTSYSTDGSQFNIADASNMYTDADSTTFSTVSSYSYDNNSHYVLLQGIDLGGIPSEMTVTSYSIYVTVGYTSDIDHTTSGQPRLFNGTTQIDGEPLIVSEDTSSYKYKFVFNNPVSWNTLSSYGSKFGIGVNFKKINAYTGSTLKIYGAHIFVECSEGASSDALYIKLNSSWVKASSVYKKINDVWVEQDVTTAFDSNIKYKTVI